MVRRFLSALVLLLLAGNSIYAGPASPDLVEVQQPDGSTIKTRIRGDEFQNWTEAAETGHTIVNNPASGYWEYAEQAKDGSLRGNGIRVLPKGLNAPAASLKRLKPPRNTELVQRQKTSLQESYRLRLDSPAQSAPTGVQAAAGDWTPAPVAGNRNTLIVLISFSNRTLTTTPASWNNTIFNATAGALSVANYYKDNSFNALNLTPASHSQAGSPDGIISVTIAATHPNSGATFNYASESTILNLALAQAANYLNFATYDTNGNNSLEQSELMIYFIYAGYEASGSSKIPNIWAHAWGGTITAGSKTIHNWALNGELNDAGSQHAMGVIAHELGHALCGLPDLYDTSDNNEAMGNFSLMAGGGWGRDTGQDSGTTPTVLDAWSREFLGWATPLVPASSGSLSLDHALATASAVYKFINPALSSSEYFLMENRQPTGWDRGLRGSFGSGWSGGLLITHIDNTAGTMPGNDINDYTANIISPGHQGVLPVQASTATCNMLTVGSTCRGSATTLFYSGNNANWSPLTSPDSNYYSGSATNFSLIGISAPGSTMTANLSLEPPVTHTLTITRSGTGSGAVTSTPAGISCGSTCFAPFLEGSVTTLKAAPAAGALFAGWSGGGCSGTGDCQITMSNDTTVNASFAPGTTVWAQNFDAVASPNLPDNWQSTVITKNGSYTPSWTSHISNTSPDVAVSPHSGTNLVLFNSFDAAAGDAATLVSHQFSLSGITTGKAKFWMYRDDISYQGSTNNDRVQIYINTSTSLSGATQLGTVYRMPSKPPLAEVKGWYEYTLDIPGTFNSTTNYLLFEGISDWGNDLHLDDFAVTAITAAPPGAPTAVAATPGNDQATITFTAPVNDGSSPILDYTVTAAPGGQTATGTASPLTVIGLTNGTAYTFTVKARNAAGSSSASTASTGVTPRTVPGAPVIGTATAGNASATVSFTAPAADGGSAIIDYTVTASPDGFTATGSSSPLTVSGLAIGTPYDFTVRARNLAGSSIASTPSNSVFPFTNIKIGSSGYPTIAAAYSILNSGSVLQLRDLNFTEAVNFNSAKTFLLLGGYDEGFIVNSGITTINGSLTITDGTVTVENISVR